MKISKLALAAWSLFAVVAAAESPKKDIAGMIVPLTGFVAEYGVAVQRGVQIYLDANPSKCAGVNFVWEDSQYDGVKTMNAFRSFAAQDAQIQYVWGSAPTEVLAPAAARSSFPLFTLGEIESLAGNSFAINFTNPAWDYSQHLLKELRRRGLKRLAIVKAEFVYFNNLVAGLEKFLQPNERLEVLASHQPNDVDFRTTITKLKKANFDAIGIYLSPGQVSNFFRQLSEQQIKITAFGTTNFGSLKEIADSKGNMEGALFADTAVTPEFREQYVQKYQDEALVATAAQAHDLAHVICGLKRGTRSEEVMAQIAALGPFEGAGEKVTLSNSIKDGRYFQFPVVVKTVKNGAPEVLTQ